MTAAATGRAPAGEAGFRLLAEHRPDVILLAFDPELRIWAATGAAIRARGWTPGHFGLIAMRERVEALGGRFRVTTAPGEGTVVEARLPLTDRSEGPEL
ncbi:MAG: sensor histidine kinase [Actinomycetia bacterium]|nr:sensor histidine kinase [Actinomycetes bacterium]